MSLIKQYEEDNRRLKAGEKKASGKQGQFHEKIVKDESKFKDLLKKLQLNGNKFYDEEFPPEPQSLICDWNDK